VAPIELLRAIGLRPQQSATTPQIGPKISMVILDAEPAIPRHLRTFSGSATPSSDMKNGRKGKTNPVPSTQQNCAPPPAE